MSNDEVFKVCAFVVILFCLFIISLWKDRYLRAKERIKELESHIKILEETEYNDSRNIQQDCRRTDRTDTRSVTE